MEHRLQHIAKCRRLPDLPCELHRLASQSGGLVREAQVLERPSLRGQKFRSQGLSVGRQCEERFFAQKHAVHIWLVDAPSQPFESNRRQGHLVAGGDAPRNFEGTLECLERRGLSGPPLRFALVLQQLT